MRPDKKAAYLGLLNKIVQEEADQCGYSFHYVLINFLFRHELFQDQWIKKFSNYNFDLAVQYPMKKIISMIDYTKLEEFLLEHS